MICYHCMRDKGDSPVCPYCGTAQLPPAEPHQLRPGTVIGGKYTVGRVLGEGGFGITYIGRNDYLETTVAIKEYYPYGYAQRNNDASCSISIATGRENDFYVKGRERFLREAKTVAKFRRQSGIVEVEDFIEENNTAYIIMEYLDGITLREFLRKNGVMAPKRAVRMLMPVMQALEKIHRAGIIHRDISPDNIMYLQDGTVKLMDFGAARTYDTENRSMSVMLKPGYAPEEQYRRGGEQGPWTDVYGICATLYRCITGKAPLDAVDRLAEDTLKKPSEYGARISPNLEGVLMYGLALRKKDRCKDMTELVRLFTIAMDEDAKDAAARTNSNPPQRTAAVNTRQPQEYRTQAVNDRPEGKDVPQPPAGYPAQPKAYPAQPTAYPPQQGSYHAQPAPAQQPVRPQAIPDQPPVKKKKGGKKRIAIIACVILLVVIGAVVGIVIMLNQPQKKVDQKKIDKAENEYYSNGQVMIEKETDDNYNILKETTYTISGKKKSSKEFELDSDGNQVTEKWYSSAGKLRYTYKNEFDSDGNIIKSTEYDYSGELMGWYEYKHDSDGNETMEKWVSPSGTSRSHYERKFDSDGNKIEEKKFNGYGSLVWTDKIEYTSDGKMKQLTEYNDTDTITDEYYYDEDERCTKHIVYTEDGGIDYYYENTYNSDGYNSKRIKYDADDQQVYRYEYEYDADGNNTKYCGYDENGDLKWKDTCQYDSRGFKTVEESYDSKGNLQYKIEYDKHELSSVFTWYLSDGTLDNYTEYERDQDGYMTKSTVYNAEGEITSYSTYEYNKNGDYSVVNTYDSSDSLEYYQEYEYDDAGKQTKVTKYDAEGKVLSEDEDTEE